MDIKSILKSKIWTKDNIGEIDIPVVNHCNLNCKCCDHFAPLADPCFADVQQYDKLMSRLFQIMHGRKIYRINLMGGEPLLHPQLGQFCEITRKFFPDTHICVVTNGILTAKLNELQTCFEQHNIEVVKTRYYKGKKFYKTNLSCCKQENNHYEICNNRSSNFVEIAKRADKDMQDFYSEFPCVQLNLNGDFYSCIIPANIEILNKYFNENFEVIKGKDYINIFEIEDIQPVLDMNKQLKIPFCDYCLNKEIVEWGISKYERTEWIK